MILGGNGQTYVPPGMSVTPTNQQASTPPKPTIIPTVAPGSSTTTPSFSGSLQTLGISLGPLGNYLPLIVVIAIISIIMIYFALR